MAIITIAILVPWVIKINISFDFTSLQLHMKNRKQHYAIFLFTSTCNLFNVNLFANKIIDTNTISHNVTALAWYG